MLNRYADFFINALRILAGSVAVISAIVLAWVLWLIISSIIAAR
jgi:hypothetical protein